MTDTTQPPARRFGLAALCGAGVLACTAGLRTVPARTDLDAGIQLAALAGLTAAFLTFLSVGWAAVGRRPIGERLGLAPGRAGVGVILLLAVGLLGLSHAIDQLINVLGLRAMSHLQQYDAAVVGAPQIAWPWMLLGLGIAPGIGEEIFFRGLLQRGLIPWLGRGLGVVTTAALFGSFHGDLVHGVGAFGLGLYLGAVALITAGTRAPVACHILNNLAAVAGVALPAQQSVPPAILALGAGLLAALCLGLARWLLGPVEPPADTGPQGPPEPQSSALQAAPGPADP